MTLESALTEIWTNFWLYTKLLIPLHPKLHQEWHKPTNRPKFIQIVGSGGKAMRVRISNPLKINDYGNQED